MQELRLIKSLPHRWQRLLYRRVLAQYQRQLPYVSGTRLDIWLQRMSAFAGLLYVVLVSIVRARAEYICSH